MGHRGASAAAVEAVAPPEADELVQTIDEAVAWLASRRSEDGHWVFELEADATIPAEYILLNHYLGDVNDEVERKLAAYLRRTQGEHGGWPLYYDGDVDLSATVKAYYALKLVGDDPDAPHMAHARAVILERGGAARANVFTRIALALFGQVPWRAVPLMRVEAMLLPRWAPFHVDKVSYWSRTVMVPLFVLAALKPKARNPRQVDIQELFEVPPEQQRDYLHNPTGHWLGDIFLLLDRVGRLAEPLIPSWLERDDPRFVTARKAIDKLLVFNNGHAYCQPCLSPVWDTALALHAMMEAGVDGDDPIVAQGCGWLRERQILDVHGDYVSKRPDVRPGGWAFQYWNDFYPDVDDTAVVVMALNRANEHAHREAIARGAEWTLGMQSNNGGWGAFDAENEYFFLQHIPFADHGALLDPPTADVTARCLGMLAQLGFDPDHPAVTRAIGYLKEQQEDDGSWFGRWGTNYVYGTWSVLSALNAIGEDPAQPYIRKAVDWLKTRQREDGGWGEDCASYWPERRSEVKASTPSQTAWATLALMAAGEVDSDEVGRGIDYLLKAPRDGGRWEETHYNAVGFPKVFYLRYHGYSAYFPLWALARYRNLTEGNAKTTMFGI